MRLLRVAAAHQRLGVAHRDRHAAREQLHRLGERAARAVGVAGGEPRLAERRVEQGDVRAPREQRLQQRDRVARRVRAHQRDRAAVLVGFGRGQVGAARARVQVAKAGFRRHGLHVQALADQRVAGAVLDARALELLGAITGFGDALGRDRVGAQQGRDVAARAAGALLHGPEEIRHRHGIEPRRRQDADADAVRLALVRAREVDLLLGRQPLGRGHGADQRVARQAGGRADQDGRQHGRHRREVGAAGVLDRARDVALRDVGDLVREHAGELAFAAGRGDQAGIDADEAARQREGVDAVVLDREEREAMRALVGMARRAACRATAGIR